MSKLAFLTLCAWMVQEITGLLETILENVEEHAFIRFLMFPPKVKSLMCLYTGNEVNQELDSASLCLSFFLNF